MAALLLLTGPQAGRRHEVQGEVFIGRSPSCTISLEDAKVSRKHVRLQIDDGSAKAQDLGSRNGTLVNGVPVMQRTLIDGDRIEIGIYRLQYVIERGAEPPDGWATRDRAMPAHVRVLSGPNAGGTLALERPIVSITNGSGQVAVIARRRSGHHVTHLEGPTYPLVNGESIGLVAHLLKHDDLVELAGTIFQFCAEPPP